ncbi:unnamed protein product [Durusdinium trenchii]|uniref:Uncharacterized protein n=1 Tax=Durusdinium trenchii TaxID=1381693 RepID=A0ABP0MFL6_9DINO
MPSVAVRNHSQFVQDYQRRFLHKPSPDAILAYAVAAHLVQAIVEAENPAMDAVTTVLQRMGSAGSVVAVQLQASSDAKVVYPAEATILARPLTKATRLLLMPEVMALVELAACHAPMAQ